ncbi:hypothetical protein [Acidibrevibacterium fodinaquatile]|uniref:hypothetical protein n=1 Tax=Acidibrevibacterium fodinaquatile TaxID=1969806 RepID=UPI0013B3C12C|nr:hypothetical protein [Acidibrevibacterium fodinaquatile]
MHENIFFRLEGLGDNCEFGIVQRYFSCDPPGLFRNVGFYTIDIIIDAIENNLHGLFDDGNYEFVVQDGWPDWRLDSCGFTFHTGFPVSIEINSEEGKQKAAQVIQAHRLLKRMFCEELRKGEKIFVYRQKAALPNSSLRRLHAAIRRHGPGWLLNVAEDPSKPNGSVEILDEGLIVAAISRLSNENPPNIDFTAWKIIAHRAWAATREFSHAARNDGFSPANRRKIMSGPVFLEDIAKLTKTPAEIFISRFESLGDNCEFGLVQRRCGAEPIDLLRWSFIELPDLIRCLENEFSGLEDPENLHVGFFAPDAEDPKEYAIYNKRLGIQKHSHILNDQISADKLLELEAKRLTIMRKKFLKQMRENDKIYVVKYNNTPSEDKIFRLFSVLQKFGQKRLLWAVAGDETQNEGTVEQLAPGLFKAYVNRFAPYDDAPTLSLEPWLAICVGVVRLLETAAPELNPPAISVYGNTIEDAITALPALYEVAAQSPVRLWFENAQIQHLWAGPPVEMLANSPSRGSTFSIEEPARLFARSGLHMMQAWYGNFGLPVPATIPKIRLAGEIREFALGWLTKNTIDVIISPFPDPGRKNEVAEIWPYDNWNRVIDTLLAARLEIAICGAFSSDAEPRFLDERFWGDRPVRVLNSFSLVELAGYLRAARCVITIANGISRLAHLVGAQHAQIIPAGSDMPSAAWVVNHNPNAAWVNEPLISQSGLHNVLQPERVLELIFSVLASFNRDAYVQSFTDLRDKTMSATEAWQHWTRWGVLEGWRSLNYTPRLINHGSLWKNE